MKLLDYVVAATAKFCAQHPKAERKRLGQFFTSPETAALMAARLDLSQLGPHVTILDPGAGTGILACALIERLVINLKSPTPLSYGFLGVVVTSQF